jgi:hypothetical protein
MMVSLLLYAYSKGNRSSRGIERACREDVAYMLISAQQGPDHSTIADFRKRHEQALAELFTGVLGLCRQAGLVEVGMIAIDGTKIAANASLDANRAYEAIAREILEEAAEVDRREDELYGQARGDELPEQLRTREGRRAALAEAKRKLEREPAKANPDAELAAATRSPDLELELDPEAIVARAHGREGWSREGRQQLDEHRRLRGDPIPRSRAERLLEAERRLQEYLAVERKANEAYEHHRATAVTSDGRRFGARPNPYVAPELPPGKINTTDLDSRVVKTKGKPAKQGYNAQAAVNERQIVIAAEITVDSPDFGHLEPMVKATVRELEHAGVSESPGVVVADPGYWHQRQMEHVVAGGIQVLIPPDSRLRKGTRPGWNKGLYAFMRRVLATDHGEALYRKRQATVEPMFAQIKFNRRIDRFQRRGRSAVRSEWRLAATTHNLLKLHSHRIAAAGA